MDLAEKYRPKTLDEIYGQDHVIPSLKSIMSRKIESIPHTFSFFGHFGCGKTTLAYIVANTLGCSEINIQYYNTANTRGIDTIRDMETACQYRPITKPGDNPIKFYILDECHEITKSGQNAMLKMLEKPPDHAYFVLCTSEHEKLLDPLRSRANTYVLKPLSRLTLVKIIKEVCKKERVTFPGDIIRSIADYSENSARNALKILDKVIDIADDDEVRKAIPGAAIEYKEIIDICRIMLDRSYTSWPDLCTLLKSIDAKPDEIRRGILGYLGSVAMNSQKYPARLITMCSLFSESIMYSNMGALVAQIGLAFQVDE